jgi:hypothetical protein
MEQARSTSRGQSAFSAVVMGWFTQGEKTYKKYLTKSRPPKQPNPTQPKTPNGLQTHHYPIFREKGVLAATISCCCKKHYLFGDHKNN